jgi:membrane-associated HD superfamily phosphohydrolase
MQEYDKKLNVKWDSSRQRWKVTRLCPAPSRLYDIEKHIMHIQNEDGGYRAFDERCFRLLKASDHHVRKTKEIIREQIESQKKAHINSLRQQKTDMNNLVADPLHWAAKKDAENFGATNLPKEDIQKAMEPRFNDVEDEVSHVASL